MLTQRTVARGVDDLAGREYAKALGDRLRRIRLQKGMSLQDVQEASAGTWKAAVIGAYERADRNVTVTRLFALAEFYGVPVPEILPDDGVSSPRHAEDRDRVVLDLESMRRLPQRERDPVERFASAIQLQRGDFNGRVLTIRGDDLLSLALLYESSPEDVTRRLREWGLLSTLP